MATTIVEYRERARPRNEYPCRIVSPPRSSLCCLTGMQAVGNSEREGDFDFWYRRCVVCGYTVRHFLRAAPEADLEMVADLRETLKDAFARIDVPA